MKLSESRFYQGHYNFRRTPESVMESVPIYSYETIGSIYDLIVMDGCEYVRVNMCSWSNGINAWRPIHYEIRHHFGIGSSAVYAPNCDGEGLRTSKKNFIIERKEKMSVKQELLRWIRAWNTDNPDQQIPYEFAGYACEGMRDQIQAQVEQ